MLTVLNVLDTGELEERWVAETRTPGSKQPAGSDEVGTCMWMKKKASLNPCSGSSMILCPGLCGTEHGS